MQVNNKLLKIPSVIFSNLILYRNINGYKFEKFLSIDKKEEIEKKIINFIKNLKYDSVIYDLNKMDDIEKDYFADNLFDNKFFYRKDGKFIYLNRNDITILLNYNDHLTIIINKPQFSLNEQYINIVDIEDKISSKFSYMASTKYGFLTSYVKNCGLGLNINVLLHLPGIGLSKDNDYLEMYTNRGYTIKKVIFNNNEELKDYYLFSSIQNFGVSEDDLINRFNLGITQLDELDNNLLMEYYLKNKDSFDDKIYRSYGLLLYAKLMNYNEALEHLTNLRIGIKLGIKIPIDITKLNVIFNKIKEGNINFISNNEKVNKDYAIIKVIRSNLNTENKYVS